MLTDVKVLEFAKLNAEVERINFRIQNLENDKKVKAGIIQTKYNFTAMQEELRNLYNDYTIQIQNLVVERDKTKEEIKKLLGE